jgi:hypothetical protein
VIAEPAANTITRPYRGLSVQDVDVPLTAGAIGELLARRDIYRRTAFLVLRNNGETALVAVQPADPARLFSPVADMRVLAGPQATAWIDEPSVDVGNASALAAAALARREEGVLAYVVRGRFEHVNFIWRPAPLTIRVTEVVPPHPPKLLAMAQQAVGFDEDLPPVTLVLDSVDVRDLMAGHPSPRYLLPCRGSGVAADAELSFLDGHPAYQPDWLLIGCDRSVAFHEHFYGTQPQRVDLCPRARAASRPGERLLTKCCLRERDIEVDGSTAVVPWGANLDEVRAALRALCGIPPAAPVRAGSGEAGSGAADSGEAGSGRNGSKLPAGSQLPAGSVPGTG